MVFNLPAAQNLVVYHKGTFSEWQWYFKAQEQNTSIQSNNTKRYKQFTILGNPNMQLHNLLWTVEIWAHQGVVTKMRHSSFKMRSVTDKWLLFVSTYMKKTFTFSDKTFSIVLQFSIAKHIRYGYGPLTDHDWTSDGWDSSSPNTGVDWLIPCWPQLTVKDQVQWSLTK